MSLENLKPAEGSIKEAGKRLGRGQATGKGGTASRGHKGAKSRSGYSKRLDLKGAKCHFNDVFQSLDLKILIVKTIVGLIWTQYKTLSPIKKLRKN
jgi:hypothetical protein